MSMESPFLGGTTEMERRATFGRAALAAIPAFRILFASAEWMAIILKIFCRAIATQLYRRNCPIVVTYKLSFFILR